MGLFDLGTKQEKPGPGYFTGFVQSTISSIPELFGMDPAAEVEAWRRGHPISGFTTQLLGTSVPYIGWAKGAKAIPLIENSVQALAAGGRLARAPIATRAAQEVVRFAPFEAARVGIASSVGGEPFGEQLLQSGLNLGFGAGVGGLIGAVESAGKTLPQRSLADIAPTVDGGAPLQIRLRQLRTALEQGEVTDALAAQSRFANWLVDSRTELPGPRQRHVAAIEGEGGGDLARELERNFFRPDDVRTALSRNKETIIRQFTHSGKTGFKDQASWQAAATEAELAEDFPLMGQFFRIVEARTDKAVDRLDRISSKLTRVGDWSIGREVDGNYVVLRRLPEAPAEAKKAGYQEWMRPWLEQRAAGESTANVFKSFIRETGSDPRSIGSTMLYSALNKGLRPPPPRATRWLAFKTDDPSAFSKELRMWKRLDERYSSWLPADTVNYDAGGQILKIGHNRNKNLPFVEYTEMQRTGKLAKALEPLRGPVSEGLRDVVEHYLTPTLNQFARSPMANWVWSGAKDLYNAADLKTSDVMLGKRELKDVKDVVTTIWEGSRPTERAGLRGLINELDEAEVPQFYKLVAYRPDSLILDDFYAKGEISDRVYNTYKVVMATEAEVVGSLAATKKALGKSLPKGVRSLFPRKWEGSLKMGLTDEGGNLIAVADGNNVRAVELRAAQIEEALARENVTGLRRGKIWDGDHRNIPPELKTFVKKPQGVRGFKWDFGQFGTRQELIEELHRNIQAVYREEAQDAFDALFQGSMKQLGETDSRTFKALTERLNQLRGESGPITQLINRAVDPVLSPILGQGAAGKIVDATNAAFWHLQLGFANFAHPVTNLLGVFQTVLPELAFVMHGAPESKAAYYSYQLFRGQKAVGIMSALDPLKLMAKGTATLFGKDPQFLKFYGKATSEGVIDPKFLEEFAGQRSAQIMRMRDALRDKGKGLPEFIASLSAWMPSASERLARSVAFSTAYATGRDLLGLTDDALYLFAKRFTERTMYNYAMADRSMVLTSPVGRLFGSMKNWVTHYISNMMLYAGEATRGNMAPLAWQMATTGVIGGIAAVPLLPTIANGYAEAVHEKNLLEALYAGVGQRGGDALYMGLPATLGVSFSSATSNPIRDANMLFSFAIWERAKALGRSVGTGFDHWQATGEHPGSSELARGALARAFAPKILYRGLQVYDNPGLESLTTGYPIIDEEVNPWNKALFVAGFQPTEIERGFVEFEALIKDRSEQQRRVARYGTALAQALKEGEAQEVENILGRALVDGLDIDKVLRSANARIDKDSKGMLERNFSAAQRQAYASIGER